MRNLYRYIKLFKYQWSSLLIGFGFTLITILAGWGLIGTAGLLVTLSSLSLAGGIALFLPRLLSFLFVTLRAFGRYFERLTTHQATFNLLEQLRLWFYDALLPLVPERLEKYRKGDLLNRIIDDIDSLDNLYIRVLLPCLSAFFFIGIIFALQQKFLPYLGWLIVALICLYSVVVPTFMMLIGKTTGEELVKLQTKLNILIVEQIQYATELIVFNQQQNFLALIKETQSKLCKAQQKMARYSATSASLFVIIWGTTLLTGMFLVSIALKQNTIDIKWIGLVIFVALVIFEGFNQLPIAFQYLGKTNQAAANLNEIIDQKPSVSFPSRSKVKLMPKNFDIEFNNVSFSYLQNNIDSEKSEKQVLNRVDLTIKHNEKIALIGKSGSGKTTLIKLILRSIAPTLGTIAIGNNSIEAFSEKDLYNLVAQVAQNSYLFNDSIAKNLRLAKPNATDDELWHVLKQVNLREFVYKLPQKLNSLVGEASSKISGGQARRLYIAQAILKDAPIILLDEPTEGLDAMTENNISKTIENIIANKTTILITHRPSLLSLTDRQIMLKNGEILSV